MARKRLYLVEVLLLAALTAGCASDWGSNGPDCTTSIGFKGTLYRQHPEFRQHAPAGRSLGEGDWLDCDESTLAHVELFAVKGVDPAIAILAKGKRQGVYVADGVTPSALPTQLSPPKPR